MSTELFNLHQSLTADGITITPGLHVFTNEMRPGLVLDDTMSRCCGIGPEHGHGPAQIQVEGVWFTHHVLADSLPPDCLACRHDHWFRVEHPDGSMSRMNGERMSTTFRTYDGNTLVAIDEYEREQHNRYVEDNVLDENGDPA